MIESLHIEDLGVIESAQLDLAPGLTALTGETGAGKTMVLTSIALLLGGRAESTIVRSGAERTVVEGSFLLDPGSKAAQRAQDAGAELDEDALIVSRVVPASGRSRAHMGGRSVPSSVLGDVGAELVSVHGQADQLRLKSPAAQRSALDSLGGSEHRELCRRYGHAYRSWREAAQELEAWRAGSQAREREIAHLRQWLEQISELNPHSGEDAELEAEASRLDHAEDLRLAAATALQAMSGDEDSGGQTLGASALIGQARYSLEHMASVDPALENLTQRLSQIAIDADDIAAEIADYLGRIDADPARLAWVQDRRATLARACREIGGLEEDINDVDALLAFAERAQARLDQIDSPTSGERELQATLDTAWKELTQAATELTQARHDLAQQLQTQVSEELAGLHMAGAHLEVRLTPLDEPGPTGAESVELLLVSHPGAPALPLGKGASGGELSRIMLALEVVLAEARNHGMQTPTHPKTLIFDEIDAGVGGKAAGEIGRRLARLSRTHQVVVVTHLPQVAAWADRQLVVRKQLLPADPAAPNSPSNGVDAGITRTDVIEVTGTDRERELARMLSGHADSDTAIRHAAELLAEAHVAQSEP